MRRIFIQKYCLFMLGNFCRVKRFQHGGKRFADDEEVETTDFYAADFDALVKRRDKCISVHGGYVEK
jgi:hypothetical protein